MTRRFAAMPVLLLVLATPARSEDALGRLFFTPAQRAQLDRERAAAATLASRPAAQQAQPKAPPPKIMTLNGVVRRNDGQTTVWVNNRPIHERFGDAEISAGSIGREGVGITLPTSGRQVRLKVGQTVDATSGKVAESYDRRLPPPTAGDADSSPKSGKDAASDAAAEAEARRREATRARRERLRAEPHVLLDTEPSTAPAAQAPAPGTTIITITTAPNDAER